MPSSAKCPALIDDSNQKPALRACRHVPRRLFPSASQGGQGGRDGQARAPHTDRLPRKGQALLHPVSRGRLPLQAAGGEPAVRQEERPARPRARPPAQDRRPRGVHVADGARRARRAAQDRPARGRDDRLRGRPAPRPALRRLGAARADRDAHPLQVLRRRRGARRPRRPVRVDGAAVRREGGHAGAVLRHRRVSLRHVRRGGGAAEADGAERRQVSPRPRLHHRFGRGAGPPGPASLQQAFQRIGGVRRRPAKRWRENRKAGLPRA